MAPYFLVSILTINIIGKAVSLYGLYIAVYSRIYSLHIAVSLYRPYRYIAIKGTKAPNGLISQALETNALLFLSYALHFPYLNHCAEELGNTY